ncbi:Ig-like domain-containing domain [Pontibacillus marinus]|uniref:SbsA Ig-like domain-containing protein n=1 Tax=Pontibacillus marinus BH030004 = DSM 16465 TaxID=1385511 RepID=A0A0A5GDH1_9BACI|nr:Ig-like domain-containing protein [Pontibacillus marinus]KGX91271.1 hypothetical protein N783_11190 [Pontibacillus marinus BH030004 = DSM 16465]
MIKRASLIVLLFFVAFANQASAESDWDQVGVSVTKEWNIQFNTVILQDSINENNIYVTDSNGNKLSSIRLRSSLKSVTVKNLNPYKEKQTYFLHITTDVKSISEKSIANNVKMKFVTAEQSSSDSSQEEDTTLNDILSEYEKKFSDLQSDAENRFNQLVKDAKTELANGGALDELMTKYSQKATELEASTDASFNAIYEDLVNELVENGYSSSEAEPFKEEYEAEKNEMKGSVSL